MRDVTDATFEADVLAAEHPVVVDFWAPWCKPCVTVTRILDELADEHPERIEVVGVDVDANPGTASRYGVLTLPTAILFEGGEARSEVLGVRSRAQFERAWASWLAPRGSM